MEEKRRFARAPFDGSAVLTLGETSFEVVLSDLSLRGALIEVAPDTTLQEGQAGLLTLTLEDTDIAIPLQCKISHVGSARAGVEFMLVEVDSMQHLRRLVELNLGNGEEHELGHLANTTPPKA